ncbi:hypothetical protein K2173_014611 [Erythroxylum novogranatense]|uniref:Uncharacterized protein n=1 Tax=Erythroxylum novogranatense TaxID=1862640 RepID=A0AAV8TH03_9ROSI|nr:hypothetical protein K2173_014611 [Erythroxylum novogranatense]
MERKRKEQKVSSGTPDHDDLQNKEEGNHPNVGPVSESNRGESPPPSDNVALLRQQNPSDLQWSYAAPNTGEQHSSYPGRCLTPPSPHSFAVNQWHQLPYLQLNANGHLQPPPLQTASHFWPPHHPGYYLPGMNAPAIYHPLTTMDAHWQIPAAIGDGTSLKSYTQTPNFSYQVCYPYPGFPALPWDPMSWGTHSQQSQPTLPCTLPGAYGNFSAQLSAMHGCSASSGQPSQRGAIRPSAKLSQKHHQLWETQSAENVQLWVAVSKLQSELADHKDHVKRLETKVSSLKEALEASKPHDTGISVPARASKRGRPRRSITSVDGLQSLATQPQTRGRKPTQSKFEHEGRLIYEKVVLNKVGNKENNCITTQQEVGSNILATASNVTLPSFHNQYKEEMASIQMSEVGLKTEDLNNGDTAKLFQQANGINGMNALSSGCLGLRNNGNFRLSSCLISAEGEKDVLNVSSQSFYNNDSVPGNDGRITPDWSFANEDDASEQFEDVLPASKDENDEMGDNTSSDYEETKHAKVEIFGKYGYL